MLRNPIFLTRQAWHKLDATCGGGPQNSICGGLNAPDIATSTNKSSLQDCASHSLPQAEARYAHPAGYVSPSKMFIGK